MNKGQAFELLIKNALHSELQRGILGLDPAQVRIFARKAYWSQDRQKEIVTDVSLELFRKESAEPFFIWVWECKDYGRPVPVDDIEEFHAKLEQIGVHRVRGTVACRDAFQESSVTYARAKGIGLAFLRRGRIIRLMESKRTLTEKTIIFGLTHPDSKYLESLFYGFTCGGKGVLGIGDLINGELSDSRTPNIKVWISERLGRPS